MKQLGKYEVIELLGSGATAEVYRARDMILGREVALKLLRPALVTDNSAFNRFLQEAQAAAGLFHPNIATVLDTGEAEGRFFIVMRYIPGRSLDAIIQQDGPQTLEEVRKMLHQIGGALDFAHKQGFLHRDVKPANLIRSEGGDYILTDFGLVRAMMTTGLTSHTGAVLGTPSYIPPEIWLNQTATPAVDQYALACVIYEMLTGRMLFTGDTPPAVMTAHVLTGAGNLDDLPSALAAPLRRALSQKPEERFGSLVELIEALEKAIQSPHPAPHEGSGGVPQDLNAHPKAAAPSVITEQANEPTPPPGIEYAAAEPQAASSTMGGEMPEREATLNAFPADWKIEEPKRGALEMAASGQPFPPEQVEDISSVDSPVRPVSLGSGDSAAPTSSPQTPTDAVKKRKLSGCVYGIIGLVILAVLAACIIIAFQALIRPSPQQPTPAPTATLVPESSLPQPIYNSTKVCLVTDTAGIDDKSFNATAWTGIQEAVAIYGVEGVYRESQQVLDFELNINAFMEEGCDLIIPAGFMLADATYAAAEANPAVNFSIVDVSYDPVVPNILGQVFRADEAAFLAGYLAAGVTRTGKIGTYGGYPIPPVTDYMDGLARGVAYYNDLHGTTIMVVGWDINNPDNGLYSYSFDDQAKGSELGYSLISEGCDVIMPVAGPMGLGTAAALKERGGYLIGVDSDWFLTAPDYADVILSSVLKNINVTVLDSVEMVITGTFTGGTTVGTLANGGVSLAPFHNLDGVVSDSLRAELEQIAQGIINGTIQTR